MPDEAGNLSTKEWEQELGWQPEAEPEPVKTVVPAPQVAPEMVPVPQIAPKTAPHVAPDFSAQESDLRGRQVELQIQQRMSAYEQQLIQQYQVTPQVASLTAQQWGVAQWAQYQQGEVSRQANEVAKQAFMEELATEHGIDKSLLADYQDKPSMRAAARQYGELKRVQGALAQQTQKDKAPVQQFAGGNATPNASNHARQAAYIRGGPSLTKAQFIEVYGFDPTGG